MTSTPPVRAWRCTVCGYVHRGPEPPDYCPVCGAAKSEFEPFEEKPAAEAAPQAEQWRCAVCGHEHPGPAPPDACPLCGAARDQFEPVVETARAAIRSGTVKRVLVAGGGIAGLSAVEALRETSTDVEIVLISREDELPYYRLNLTRYLAGEVGDAELPIHPEAWYAGQGVQLLRGAEVTSLQLDEHQVTLRDKRTFGYDKLILTVGAHPFIPPFPGAQRDGVTSLRTVGDARRIRQTVSEGMACVCIGGGILGLETAGALARNGARVVLLEGHEWLMPRQLNRRAGELLADHAAAVGIKLRTMARTAEIAGDGRASAVLLENGDALPADLVIITTGIRPNSCLARQASLEVNQGIVVDNLLISSHPDVLAAGDAAEHRGTRYGIWPASQFQGHIAGLNALGMETEFGGIPRSNTLKVLGYDMFSIGRVEPEDGSFQVLENEAEGWYCRFIFRDSRLVGAVLLGDTSVTGAVKKAIETKTDLSGLLNRRPSGRDVAEHLAGSGKK